MKQVQHEGRQDQWKGGSWPVRDQYVRVYRSDYFERRKECLQRREYRGKVALLDLSSPGNGNELCVRVYLPYTLF